MVEQLKRLAAQVSILSLLLLSEAHRDALLKILNESHVPEGIATNDLKNIVGQIADTNTITFNEDELLPKGTGNVKSFHIAVECSSVTISRVLIDNKSALNASPTRTLERIGVEESTIHANG